MLTRDARHTRDAQHRRACVLKVDRDYKSHTRARRVRNAKSLKLDQRLSSARAHFLYILIRTSNGEKNDRLERTSGVVCFVRAVLFARRPAVRTNIRSLSSGLAARVSRRAFDDD